MSLQGIARRLESAAAVGQIIGRTVLSLDTNPVPGDWTHVTKVDPEGEKKLPYAYPLYLAHTSAVSVGGSRDVTDSNTEETFDLLSTAPVPTLHEPSAAEHVTTNTRDAADFFAVPEVLNGDSEALVGTLGKGLAYVREELGPEMVESKVGLPIDGDGVIGNRLADLSAAFLMHDAVFEAYIIMNPDSAAAREANVSESDLLTPQEAKERALAAEYHLESDIIYLEYSGTYGGREASELLEEIADAISWSRIWYGGGLDSREKVAAVRDAGADTVVVGDVFHDIADVEADLVERARETFDGVPSFDDLERWVDEQVDRDTTPATRYLSTIETVDEPAARAIAYLTSGVLLALVIDDIDSGLGDPDAVTLRRVVDERTYTPVTEATEPSVSIDESFDRVALGLLADRHDVAVDAAEPVEHFHRP
jgi:phosphoglycerol geranylgeranyltransferase